LSRKTRPKSTHLLLPIHRISRIEALIDCLKHTILLPPKGQASWDGVTLAKAVGAKKSSFNCDGPAVDASAPILRFAAKAADMSRRTCYVRTSSGKIVRGLKSTYQRNGTLNLFAALHGAAAALGITPQTVF
jgi:hypothetical protein